MRVSSGVLLLVACGEPPAEDPTSASTPTDDGTLVLLTDEALAVRTSQALRGTRPTPDELDRLDDASLDALIDGWLSEPGFTEVMLDWTHEAFLLRVDVIEPLPPIGAMEGSTEGQMHTAVVDAPFRLVAHVVDEGLPLTELLTADYGFVNATGAEIWGIDGYDPSGPDWQRLPYEDGRPAAGLLSTPWTWIRHESNGNNFNRARAEFIADSLLCESFNVRDVLVDAEVNLAEPDEVTDAVASNPTCIGCHQSLDPLSGYLWGFTRILHSQQITFAHNEYACDWNYPEGEVPVVFYADPEDYCYPLKQYFPEEEDAWGEHGLPTPSFYTRPAHDLADLGHAIADDPRFSRCMAKRFFSFFAQVPLDDVPDHVTTDLQATLVEADFDPRALAAAVVRTPEFRAAGVAPGTDPVPWARRRPVRPEQLARIVEDLTGYRWWAVGDPEDCAAGDNSGNECWEVVDLTTSDLYGYRAMLGGLDGFFSTTPQYTATPTRLLAIESLAWDAARHVVEHDRGVSAHERRLLTELTDLDAAAPEVRAQLVALWRRMYGARVADDDARIDALVALYDDLYALRGDAEDAWTAVIATMLQDPELLFS